MKLNLATAIWAAILPFGYTLEIYSYSKTINGVSQTLTCNVDSNWYPLIDCLNTIPLICDPMKGGNGAECLIANNKFYDAFPLTSPWRTFGDNCLPARVSTAGTVSQKFSAACNSSIQNLQKNGKCVAANGKLSPVTSGSTIPFVDSAWAIYGPLASITPAKLWPPISDPKYLSVGTVTPLSKRAFVFSIQYSGYRFDCNKDANNNPMQDCLNSMKNFCSVDATICKSVVDYHVSRFNLNWQDYLNNCASWKNNNNYAQATSSSCSLATIRFLGAVTTIYDASFIKQQVDLKFTESMISGLWGNQTILKASSQDFLTWLSTKGKIF